MKITAIKKLKWLKHSEKVLILAKIRKIEIIETHRSGRMAFVNLQDDTGATDAVIFPDTFLKYEDLITTCFTPIYFSGEVNDSEDGSPNLIICESSNGFCKRYF